MTDARHAQPIEPRGASAFTLAFPGGRADVIVARIRDARLPAQLTSEIDEVPTRPLLRAGYLARRSLARAAIARRLPCDAGDVRIGHAPSGAPLVAAPVCGLHVSLSGRDGLAAAAIADRPVGVDIEPVGEPFEHPLNVLHPAERAALDAAGQGAHDWFLRIWTAKEAYLKALWTGFGREPSEIRIEFAASGEIRIVDRGRNVDLAASCVRRVVVSGAEVEAACIVL